MKQTTKKNLKKAAMITEIAVIGTIDALVVGPLIRPVSRLVKTTRKVIKATKENDTDKIKEYVYDSAVDAII